MKAKTGFNRFVSIFLSVAIAISALAGLSLGGLVSAAGEEIGTMKFFVNHWHTVDESGNPISETETHEYSNYHEEFYGTIVLYYDGTYELKSCNFSSDPLDTEKFEFKTDTGELTVKVSPRGSKSETWESLAGLSVSAGHNAVDTQADAIVIEYKKNVSVVKCDVFYKNDSKYVSGGYDNKVEGTENLENDTGYVYVDDATGTPVRDGADNLITETNEGKADHLVEAQTQNSDSPVRLVKMYSTLEGLHTDKTAYAVEDDGRTFNLELESWYVGAKAADVGMILDASGSMASPTNTLQPISDAIKRLDDLSNPIDENGFLTDEALERILKQTETDNSPLGVSGYGYYLFDGRSSTNDYFPIGYWDGTTPAPKTEPLIPHVDSLIGYYPFIQGKDGNKRAWFVNQAKTDDTTTVFASVTYQSNSTSNISITKNTGVNVQENESWGLTSVPLNFSDTEGLNITKSTGGLLLDVVPENNSYTISFKVKLAGEQDVSKEKTDEVPEKNIFYIGPFDTSSSTSEYFRMFRGGYKKKDDGSGDWVNDTAKFRGRYNSTNLSEIKDIEGWKSKTEKVYYLTYVFKDGNVETYLNGSKSGVSTATGSISIDDRNIVFNGFGDNKSSEHLKTIYVDEIYVFDTAYTESDVKKLYDNVQSQDKLNLSKSELNETIKVTSSSSDITAAATPDGETIIGTLVTKDEKYPTSAGWYYVSFSNDWENRYNNELMGTGKNFRHLHGEASYKATDNNYYDLVYYYDYGEAVAMCQEIDEEATTVDPNLVPGKVSSPDDLSKKIPNEDNEEISLKLDSKTATNAIESYYLSETSEKNAEVSRIVYNPADGSDSNCTPLKFFIDPEGYLCCFFSSNHSSEDMDDERYGWSYVFSNEGHTERTKVESLQYALGTFATGLLEASSSSRVSATRFSTDDITDADYGNFVLLDWTNDPQEANSILSLERGADGLKGSSTGYDEDTDESGKTELREYNYGLTGGTTTEVGLKAYSENLDKKLGSDDNREKYLIIFTDGKDTSDAIKNYTGDVGEDFAKCIQGLSGADAAPAYTAAKQLKDKGYTIYCVMLAGGAMGTESKDYGLAKQFLTYLSSGCPADGESYDASAKSKYVLSGTNTAELEQAFKNILDDIASDLEDYTVQDYIDPRFDLVDADGNTWNLKAKGEVEITLKDAAKPTTITTVEYDESSGTLTESGDTMPANLSKTVGLEINLSNDGAYKDEGNIAYLFYDETANMYFLRWLDQSIPSCTPGSSRLPVWNARVTVRAKDDFIGGNAVTTNGNSADQNYVYMNDDTAPSSGTTNAGKDYDPAAASYPSKGFPRTTVNVAVPSLVLTGGEQVIYMGEELTPDGVAEKLGETILDKWATFTGADKSGTQWYWEYLDRYAKYNRKDLEDIIKEIVAAEKNGEGSIEYPYFYIPRYDEDNKLLNQTGSSKQHEQDKLGTLIFTWTTVDEEKEGKEYPESNKGGTTVDTDKRVSTLEVQYIPLQADDGDEHDGIKDRKDYINETVQNEEDSDSEAVYPWDPEYKPAAGEPTDLTTTETEEDKTPDDNGLLDTGSYTTKIVRGQINLACELDETTFNYVKDHFADPTITYTAVLKRYYSYEVDGKTVEIDAPVGTFTAEIKCTGTRSEYYPAKFALNDEYKLLTDEDNGGLPIGEYYIDEETTKLSVDGKDDWECLTFTAEATAIGDYVKQFEGDIYKPALEAPAAAAAITAGDITEYAAPFSGKNIQLGYDKTTKGKTKDYTDDLLGMYIASPNLLKGDLSITKTVIDNVNPADSDNDRSKYNKEFTFKVTLDNGDGEYVYGTFNLDDGTSVGKEGGVFKDVEITVKAGETVTIEGIPAGTHYTVTEVEPTDPNGYTLNKEKSLNVTGVIEDKATKTATFVNEYNAEGTVQFNIEKTLVGRDWISGETFTFAVKPDADTAKAISDKDIDMSELTPISDGKYVIAVATKDEPLVLTDKIKFKKAGIYTFTVSEVNDGKKDDIEDNTQKYTLTVTVDDRAFGEEDGGLTTSVSYAYETDNKGVPDETNPIPFKNTVSTQIDFDITKVLKGRDWDGDTFTVNITTDTISDGAEAPVIAPSSVTISDDDDEHTKTATITFYSVGKYTFTVKEANGTDSNMLYDEEYKDGHTVIVVVGQNDDVGLTITSITVDGKKIDSTSAADITITNEYTVTKDVSIGIPVTKTFADGKWIDGTYSFDIDFDDSVSEADKAKITLPESVNISVKDGTAYFKGISFKNIVLEEDPINGGYSKTFNFVVKEQNGGKTIDGITYDGTVYNVEVTITDGAEPTVKVTKAGETGDVTVMSFENEYSADPAEWTPKVQKTFTGREGDEWLDTDEFTFTITQDEDDDVKVTLLSSITIGKDTTDDHTASFGTITFNTEGIYHFTISEAEPTANGITKGTSDYKVTVVVTDNLKGQLEYTVTYTDSEDNEVEVTDNTVEFTNTYTPKPVTWKPSIDKQIEDPEGTGRDTDWQDSDSFTFEITLDSPNEDKSVEMPEPNTVTISNKNSAGSDGITRTGSFEEITFNKAGDYTFTIEETGQSSGGIIHDTHGSYTVKVTVEDDTNGKLSITHIIYENRDKESVDQTTNTESTSFLFINTHKHKAVHWYPTVSKDIGGRDWISGDEFKFTIELAEDQAPGTVVNTVTVQMETPNVATVKEENTSTAFEDITFTEIGEYKFIVTENDLTESNGLTKDETKYTVTVTVENKSGTENELKIAKVEVYNSKTEKTETYKASEDVNVNFKFTNIYSASGTIDIPVSKNLEGRAWKPTDSFTFEISTTDKNVTIPATSKTVTINGTDGTEGKFADIAFTEVGTYTFTIKESQESKIDHITYSTEKYTVEVTVKDNGNGTLNATITKVTEAKDPTKNLGENGIVFTNTYTPDSVTWTPYVSKTIVDEDDPTRGENWLEEVGKDTFTFTVSIAAGKNYGDNVMPKNAEVIVDHTNHTSSVPFDSIKFTKGGTYEFVIKETEGEQDGIIYDHTKYNVTVEVSDDTTNGTLSIASVTYKDREGDLKTETGAKVNVTFPFINKHHHDAVKLDLSAQKKLTGRDWHDGDEFTFTVTQDSSDTFTAHMPTPNTATVKGPDAGDFSDITFTEVGEYHFTVKENELSDDVKKYITPVVSEHKVYVKIDDHDGKLYISEMKIDGKEVTNLPKPSDFDFETKRPTISHVLEFENKYSAKPAQIQIPVSKVLDGREWTADDSFTFTISPDTYSSTNTITIQNTGDEYNEGDIKGYQGFFVLTFDLEDIDTSKDVNEFTFTISENSDSPIDHITYSDEEYTVTVKVTDNYTGELTAEITEVTNKAGEDVTALGEGIIFTNTYTPAPVEWTPSVTKEINGRSEWNPNYSFDFTITPESTDGIYYKDSDGNEQPYTAQDIFINSETLDHTESFKTVIFRQKGKYTFTVKETVPAEAENNQPNGITYDDKDHTVVVTVDDTDGQLEISTITVDGKDVTTEGTDTTKVKIINTYSANGSWPPVVEKSFDTRKWDDSDNGKYTFVLSLEKTPSGVDKSTVTIPNGGTITISGGKKDAESVTGTFGDVGFTKPGTYEFKLTEKTYTGGRGVTSAETVYNITVEVTDNGNGKLTTVSAVTKDGEEYNGTNYAFVNTYTPSPATWTPSVQKKLEGADWNGYTFTFSITSNGDYGDAVEMTDTTIDISYDNAPDYTAQFGKITFTKAGTYVFTIAEVDTGIDNIVYDKTGRIVTVEVVDDPVEGKLKIDLDSITVKAGTNSYTLNEGDNISFTNYYTVNAIVKNAIKVEKELDTENGRDWLSSDTFSFRLTLTQGDASNVVMKVDDKQVDELTAVISGSDPTKSAVFSDIEFTAEGTYVFTVSEIIPDGATVNVYHGVTYDENSYEVTVVVTLEEIIDDTDPDNIVKEYYLVAEVQDNDDGVNDGIVTFSFTNTAVPATLAEASINVKKTLEGKEDDWGNSSFSFKIEPDDDYGEDVVMPTETEISISAANAPDYTAYFDKIIFNKVGKYHFTVSEVIPAGVDSDNTLDDITYDVNTHEVVVKVDVDANNNLVATIQDENDVALSNVTVEFTNKYTPPSTPTPPSTNPPPVTNPTPSTPTQPTTSEDTSAPEQTTGPEETTPEETTSEATTASSEESTVPSEETTPDTTDSEDVSENDGYNTNVDGDGDKNMNTGVPFGSAIMMCALSSLAVAVAVRKKKNGRNDK